jgi:2-keto-4-pentenoate hydratase
VWKRTCRAFWHGHTFRDVADTHTVVSLADELWEAEQSRRPIEPLTDRYPELAVEDTYAIQTHNIERRIAAGARVVGRKIGLTSRGTQEMLGMNEPDFGVLLDDMLVEDGDVVDLDSMLQPRIEGELAFVMDTDLAGPGVSTANALAAIGGVLPAVEIVDSRIADWRIKLAEMVADNADLGPVTARFSNGAGNGA